jgi:hypothetical protein
MNRLKTFLKGIIPKRWKKIYKKEILTKKAHKNKTHNSKVIFEKIHDQNLWSNNESVSGNGSDNKSTQHLKTELETFLVNLNIKTFADIPCGDFNWIQYVNLSQAQYLGGDIVQALVDKNNELYKSDIVNFKLLDITSSNLPKVDLILCRDCLVHLSFREIYKAITNIKKSKSTYLLTTSFIDHEENLDIHTGDWRALNFVKAPFSFKKPKFVILENSDVKFPNKALCLWEIDDIEISKLSFYIKSNIFHRFLFN